MKTRYWPGIAALLTAGIVLAIASILDQIYTANAPLALAIQSCLDNFDYDQILAAIPESTAQPM